MGSDLMAGALAVAKCDKNGTFTDEYPKAVGSKDSFTPAKVETATTDPVDLDIEYVLNYILL